MPFVGYPTPALAEPRPVLQRFPTAQTRVGIAAHRSASTSRRALCSHSASRSSHSRLSPAAAAAAAALYESAQHPHPPGGQPISRRVARAPISTAMPHGWRARGGDMQQSRIVTIRVWHGATETGP
jgi:hypothetical protein